MNVNKPCLHTWGRAQAYASEKSPCPETKESKLCRVLWPCPCTYLPPPGTPLPPPGVVIWQMCAARRLSDPPKKQTDAFIYYSRRRSNSMGRKAAPYLYIYIYICVGKSEFLELEGRRGVGALSGIFMAFRCRHNLISKGRIKSKYGVRCLNWQTINSRGPGQ